MTLQLQQARASRNHAQQWYRETFDTDKTTNWGTQRLDSATLTLTNLSAQGKMRVNSTGYNGAIQVTASPKKQEKTVQMQFEVVNPNNGGGSYPSYGLSLWSTTKNVLTILCATVNQNIAIRSSNSLLNPDISTIHVSDTAATIPTAGVHELKLVTEKVTATSMRFKIYIDSTLIMSPVLSYYPDGALISAGPYLRNCTLDFINWQELI